MIIQRGKLTTEQEAIVAMDGSAFIVACPGAGKTRVMVERAVRSLPGLPPGRGMAFISFTKEAVSELESRIRNRINLGQSVFPSFIGTFDSFVWQFFVEPFGIGPGQVRPRTVADIEDLAVGPNNAQQVSLRCFDPETHELNKRLAREEGFDATIRSPNTIQRYEEIAARVRKRLFESGFLGFSDSRRIALERIRGPVIKETLGKALSARFAEVVVDEAQDCNPEDLQIMSFLKDSGMPVKVICDPNQSIYSFRGGVNDELEVFSGGFEKEERKELSGNFRSSQVICDSISCLRAGKPSPDRSLGQNSDLGHSVHVMIYKGKAVSPEIGNRFRELVLEKEEPLDDCVVLAKTWRSSLASIGLSSEKGKAKIVLLAEAAMRFHVSRSTKDIIDALDLVHRILLSIQGKLEETTYSQYLVEAEADPNCWRPQVISILQELKFDEKKFDEPKLWHEHAKSIISEAVDDQTRLAIGKKLKWDNKVCSILKTPSPGQPKAESIHSAKGKEFSAVCVITTSPRIGTILDYLESKGAEQAAEDARLLYVGASRAKNLLAFAVPEAYAERFVSRISLRKAAIKEIEI